MSDVALPGSIEPAARKGPDLSGAINPLTAILFGGVLAAMVLYVAYSIYNDIGESGTKVTSYAPFLLLFVALLIALGFEFVNGFHDTANAVATVIYTRSLPANFAVVWSGMFNLAGVLASSGAVAFVHHADTRGPIAKLRQLPQVVTRVRSLLSFVLLSVHPVIAKTHCAHSALRRTI